MSIAYYPCDIIVPPCDAIFKVLNVECQSSHCHTCFRKSDKLLQCRNCNVAKYCGHECREQDLQNGHHLVCKSQCYVYCQKSWAKDYHVPLFLLYALLESNPHMKTMKYPMHDGTFRGICDLVSNKDLWACEIDVQNMCADLVRHLRNEDRAVTTDYFIFLHGILMSNSIEIRNGEKSVGQGIYIECTPFDHSCRPTAKCCVVDGKLYVQALVFIGKDEFPLISYVDLKGDVARQDPQKFLMEKYKFRCFCEVCRMEYDIFGSDISRLQTLNCAMEFFKCVDELHSLDFESVNNLHQEHIGILERLRDQCGMEIAKHSTDFADLAMNMGMGKETCVPLYHTAALRITEYVEPEHNMIETFFNDRPYLNDQLLEDDFSSSGDNDALNFTSF